MLKRFDLDGSDFTIDSLIEINNPDIIYEIIHGIFYGVAKGEEKIEVFEIKTKERNQVFTLHRRNWIKSLNKCMESMISIEDYETCSEIKKAISILEKNVQSK